MRTRSRLNPFQRAAGRCKAVGKAGNIPSEQLSRSGISVLSPAGLSPLSEFERSWKHGNKSGTAEETRPLSLDKR